MWSHKYDLVSAVSLMSGVFVEKLFCGLECVYVSVQCYLCVCRVYSQCFSVTVCRECLFSVTHTSNVWIISVLSAEIDFSSFFGVVSSKASRSLLHLLGNRSDSFSFRRNWVYFISACVYQTSNLSGRIYMKAAELVLSLLETFLRSRPKNVLNKWKTRFSSFNCNCNPASVLILVSVILV